MVASLWGRLMRHRLLLGSLLVVLGAALVAASVLATLGRWPYLAGALLLLLGVGLLLSRLLPRAVPVIAGCVVAALLIGGGAWLSLHGWPDDPPHWDRALVDNAPLAEGSVRQGGVLFSKGTARDVGTGEVLWSAAKGSKAIATTDELVLVEGPSDDTDRRRITAHLLGNGYTAWWADVGARPRVIAMDFVVLAILIMVPAISTVIPYGL